MINLYTKKTGLILNLFFQNPDREYYLREIAHHLGCEPGYFQHTIKKLIQEGIFVDHRQGNLRFFRLNKNHPLYDEIKKIVSKTVGLEAQLKDLMNHFQGIEHAFIFGSIAKGSETAESDVDLLLIGQADPNDLVNQINHCEEKLKREINYHIYDKKEIIQKCAAKNEFLTKIFNEPKIMLKGNLNDLKKSH